MLSIEALKTRDIDFDWCVNLYEDKEDFKKVTQPYYDAVFPAWQDSETYAHHIKDVVTSATYEF